MLAKERVLTKLEVRDELNRINHKKVIKTTSIGIVSLGVFKLISNYSDLVDKFIFANVKEFLQDCDILFLGIPVPNWFTVILVLGFIAGISIDVYFKIIKKSR